MKHGIYRHHRAYTELVKLRINNLVLADTTSRADVERSRPDAGYT